MNVLYSHCAGLDIHKETVVACARMLLDQGGVVSRNCRAKPSETFATTTRGLLALADWLEALGCTTVAMEASGVYWKPVWHVLEPHFELILANAKHIKNVPGRKSDVSDAAWIAALLAHGLIRASFVPSGQIQELRDLTRTRKQLVREISQHTLRLQKVLTSAGYQLTGLISDLIGISGRAILRALIAGETEPERLADLADGRLKAPRLRLVEALHGVLTDHHRFLLKLHLEQVEVLEQTVATVEARLAEVMTP